MLFQTCINFFLVLNTKEDFFLFAGPNQLPGEKKKTRPTLGTGNCSVNTLFKITFIFNRRKKAGKELDKSHTSCKLCRIKLKYFGKYKIFKYAASSGTHLFSLVLCNVNKIYCTLILHGSLLCIFKAKYL